MWVFAKAFEDLPACLVLAAVDEQWQVVLEVLMLNHPNIASARLLKYQVDRYFKLDLILDSVLNGVLFAESLAICLLFKTKPTKDQQAVLINIINALLPTQYIIILCCGLFTKIEATAIWLKIPTVNYAAIRNDHQTTILLLNNLLKLERLNIDSAAQDLLAQLTHNNPIQLLQSVRQLALLVSSQQRNITVAELQEYIADTAQYTVFALSEAYLTGDIASARKIFITLTNNADIMPLIVWKIHEDIRQLLQIKGKLKLGQNFASAVASLNIWNKVQANSLHSAQQRLSYTTLATYLAQLANIDMLLKGAISGNTFLLIERLIIALAS
jgi:DNA polymerase III delta subunit